MAQARPKLALSRRSSIIALLILVLIILLIAQVFTITEAFNTILLDPMLNFLILIARYVGSFGLAIILMTILVRLLVYPLTMRQLRSSKAMRDIQPRIKELQERYKDNKEQLGLELTKLYREAGVNPMGCLFVTISQTPIWVALYLSIAMALAYTPENLVGLSDQLYSPTFLQNTVPINEYFLGMNLTYGNILMAIIEGVTMWMLQMMSIVPNPDRQQQRMSRYIMWGMTLGFALLAFILPSGLALYWITSNIVGMVIQYQVTGWGSLKEVTGWGSYLKRPSLLFQKKGKPQPVRNPRAKIGGTASTTKNLGQGVTQKKVGTKTASTSPEIKGAAKDDASSSGEKAGFNEPGDEVKE